jgi:hypothetical protein
MTRDDLINWARTYAAADARFRAARVAWAQREDDALDDEACALSDEYCAARSALEAAETGLDDIAHAIVEYMAPPERTHARTRWDGAQ